MTNQLTAIPEQPHERRTDVVPYDGQPPLPPAVIYQSPYNQQYTQYPEQYRQYPESYQQPGQNGNPYMVVDPSVCMRVIRTDCMVVSKEPLHGFGCGCNGGAPPALTVQAQSAKKKR